jgi:rhodanese-related sulfurtransferase
MLNSVFKINGIQPLLLLLIFLLLTLNCQGQTGVQKLTPDGFEKKMLATSEKIILDVRTPGEFSRGHLTGAILIDYYRDDFKSELAKLDKSKPVFVYCAAGSRSGSASKLLSQLGFKEIYDLHGGLSAWAEAGKSVTR